ncbi:hypothetical protein P3T23_004514 [Paraburkholderia sp. GAS448]|uniref:hypothetical protein n=1 Tax=Paraburkholderia sp. GAS448 TaxID=3035136 RepID=UPI003D20D5A5
MIVHKMAHKLIVRVVPYRTIKTCLALREAGCHDAGSGEPLRELDLHVRIERVHCYHPEPLKQVWNGCCYVPCDDDGRSRCPFPVIDYPAFERDREGRICFYWDRLLYTQPSGRYRAAVRRGEHELLVFGLQLDAAPVVVEQVANVEVAPCDCGA